MSQTNTGLKAFTATEALEAYRRVKLTSGSGTAVEYADQSDSDNHIGWTVEAVALGAPVTVILKDAGRTVKAVAADTFSVGATLYAADDGKVSDTSSGNVVGTALEACTAAGDIVEIIPNTGSGSASTAASIANNTALIGQCSIIRKTVSGAATTAIYTAALPRKYQILDAWSVNKSANDGTWKITDGTHDIISAVSVAASDTDIDRAADIDDAYATLAASSTLSIVSTGTGFSAEIYLLVIPVA